MKNKGFTLIELMVVVALIAILAAIAIPMYTSFKHRATLAVAVENLESTRYSLSAYLAQNDGTCYPKTEDITDYNSLLGFLSNHGLKLSKHIGGSRWTEFLGYESNDCSTYDLSVEALAIELHASPKGVCCTGDQCGRIARNIPLC